MWVYNLSWNVDPSVRYLIEWIVSLSATDTDTETDRGHFCLSIDQSADQITAFSSSSWKKKVTETYKKKKYPDK